MIVSYRNRFFDLWLFNAEHQARSIAGQVYFVGVAGFLAWIASSSEACVARGNCVGVTVFAFFLGYLALVGVQLLYNAMFLYSQNNRTLFTDHRIEVRTDGLYEETSYRQSLFRWHGIRRVVRMRSLIAIYISGQAAILVPSRAFLLAEVRNAFERLVRERAGAVQPTVQADGPASGGPAA